jgi:spore germination cell wall hydrolase CwlJ-like protein
LIARLGGNAAVIIWDVAGAELMFFRRIERAALAAVVGVLCCAFAGNMAYATDATMRNSMDQEKRALETVSGNRLQAMISEPAKPVRKIAFSKEWVDSQPKANGDAEWLCLSEALYFEARGESVKGQFAVAEVIKNRVKSARFPGTMCGVIHQGTGRKYQCQFTYTCDGNKEVIREPLAYERVSKVARAVLDGKAPELTSGATHYHTNAVRPKWARVYTKTANIGVHIFYRHNYRATSVSTQSKS